MSFWLTVSPQRLTHVYTCTCLLLISPANQQFGLNQQHESETTTILTINNNNDDDDKTLNIPTPQNNITNLYFNHDNNNNYDDNRVNNIGSPTLTPVTPISKL